LSQKPRGESNAKFFKRRGDLLSPTDEDPIQFTEAADQSGGHTLGSQICEALIQMNGFFFTKETIDNLKHP
jgi:hypothetical protein